MKTDVKPLSPTSRWSLRLGRSKRERRNLMTAILFISPWIIGFSIFNLYPMVYSLYISFTEYHIKIPSEWIGLTNYVDMVNDVRYWKALTNTLYMVALAVPLTLISSFLCALLLNLKLRGQSIYRVIYFLPSITPVVATSMLWLWMFNTNNGLINPALDAIGIRGPSWLTDPNWTKPAFILMGMWGMGGTIVIYLSGLQDVPLSLLEAAELDGASWWQRMRHVTIPMVSPITLFNLVIGAIGMFQYFTQAFIFAQHVDRGIGGPLDSTLFYSVYLYDRAFGQLKFGYASAMAWILFIIIMIFTILLLRFSERWTYYADAG